MEASGPPSAETMISEDKGGFKAIVLVPVESNLTREVPMSPREALGIDTTHERVTPKGNQVQGTRGR